MKNALFIILLFGCTLFFKNCDDDNSEDIYSGCCDTTSIVSNFPGIDIFVPNVFTPNFDGINDKFTVYTSSDNSDISSVSFEIQDRDRVLLFSIDDINFGLNGGGNWDGKLANNTIYEGLFYFQLEVIDTLGELHLVNGQACAIICDGETVFPIDYLQCYFGTQHDGQGGLDGNINPLESQCR